MFVLSSIFVVIVAISCFHSYKCGKKEGLKLGQHMGFKDGYCKAKMESVSKNTTRSNKKDKSRGFEWIG